MQTQDIYLYSQHIPTTWEYVVWYAAWAKFLVGNYMCLTLVLNQIVKVRAR